LDILSLMALTISTGFVVDDAIVVLENITRHLEMGKPRMQAALEGTLEVGFTVVSITASLIAVFLPLLLMPGIIGRFLREFAVTLSVAVLVSMAISLTTTPMLCALFLKRHDTVRHGAIYRLTERGFLAMQRFYDRTLAFTLRHSLSVILVLFITIGLNVPLWIILPKNLIPQQDTGQITGMMQGDQSISFQSMEQKLKQYMAILAKNPAIDHVAGFTGGRQTNGGFIYISLKPVAERSVSADEVIKDLRPQLAQVAGARLFLQVPQDLRSGGRQSNAQYQYTLQGDNSAELYDWANKLTLALQKDPDLADVNADQQQGGLQVELAIDRESAARLQLNLSQIDNTLYDAFGQRSVSTIFNPLNQYHVIMELAPKYWQDPGSLAQLWISTSGGSASGSQTTNLPAGTVTKPDASATSITSTAATIAADSARNAAINAIATGGSANSSSGASVSTAQETMVPLSAFSSFSYDHTPLAVNHQGQFVASTISFNLPPGKALTDAQAAIAKAEQAIKLPASIHGFFAGTAALAAQSFATMPLLVLAAFVTIYIVLGVLYESYIHPVTILSTVFSAAVGAFLALLISGNAISLISFIGIILLIGIVKKNAIMMIDFALVMERENGMSTKDAIYHACQMRFRPIMMTTTAAFLGALPLVLGGGAGSELRHPLGIAIAGGLLVSQMLTLYTTPAVYIYLDRFSHFVARLRGKPANPSGLRLEPGE
jgi:multidrug efflux pump